MDLLNEEQLEFELSEIFEEMEKDEDLGKAIEKVFAESNEIDEIRSKVILLIKKHLSLKNKLDANKAKKRKEQRVIEKDIFRISEKFIRNLDSDTGDDITNLKERKSIIGAEAKKDLKRIIKNFAIYEVYKMMNPKRIAGETKKINYTNNLIYKGEKLASKYEGGRESDLKKYNRAEVSRIKNQVSLLKKQRNDFDR